METMGFLAAIARRGEAPGLAEARILRARGRERAARRLLRRLSAGDDAEAAVLLEYGHALRSGANLRAASCAYRRAVAAYGAAGDEEGRADALFGLAAARLLARDLNGARSVAEVARRIYGARRQTARAAAADRMIRTIGAMARSEVVGAPHARCGRVIPG